MRTSLGWLSLVCFFLGGCGGHGHDAPIKLKVLMHINDSFQSALNNLIQAYQVDHPKILFEINTIDYDSLVPYLDDKLSSGEEDSDIIQLFGSWMGRYSKYLRPVPASIMTLDQSKELFFDLTREGFTINDTLYGLPQESNLEYGCVLVNNQMLSDSGVNTNNWTTMEQVLIDAEKIATDHPGIGGFDFLAGDALGNILLAGILQQGGDYMNADKTQFTFNTPEAKATANWMLKAVNDYKVIDVATFANDTEKPLTFFGGRAAIVYVGSWGIAEGLDNYPDFGAYGEAFSYIRLPPLFGNEHKFVADSGWGLTVSAKAKHPNEAWDFIKFAVADPTNAKSFNQPTGTIPAMKDLIDDPDLLQAAPWLTVQAPLLAVGKYMGNLPDRDTLFYTVIQGYLTKMLQGQITVDTALQEIDTDANATFSQ